MSEDDEVADYLGISVDELGVSYYVTPSDFIKQLEAGK